MLEVAIISGDYYAYAITCKLDEYIS